MILTGCSTWDQIVVTPTSKVAADQIENYCQEMKNNPGRRCTWTKEINKHYETSNLIPVDCDGDGQPDNICPE
jgi:hypothetical protein